jgi:hypothetical protein
VGSLRQTRTSRSFQTCNLTTECTSGLGLRGTDVRTHIHERSLCGEGLQQSAQLSYRVPRRKRDNAGAFLESRTSRVQKLECFEDQRDQ